MLVVEPSAGSSQCVDLGEIYVTDWWMTPLAKELVAAELQLIERLLPQRQYPVGLQVQGPLSTAYWGKSNPLVKFQIVSRPDQQAAGRVVADANFLPFAEQSVDLLILPHVLDFSECPHDVLRESTQCVTSDGALVIVGFNPMGSISLIKMCRISKGSILSYIQFQSANNVRRLLATLGFEVFAGEFTFFRPPINRSKILRSLKQLELAGARWWPALGSVYILVARRHSMNVSNRSDLSSFKLLGRARSGVLARQ